jgi:uncharacterized membrane protein YccF (DUF307 family)
MILLRIVYFLLVGWWLGLLAGVVGYLLCASFIGAPLGTMIFNRYPQILTLRPVKGISVRDSTGRTLSVPHREINIFIRILYFLVVGWWLGALALKVGWILCITIIGMPVGLLILNRLPLLMTLKQNY